MLTFCHEATKMIDPTAPQPIGDTALRVSKISFGMWGLAQGWGVAKGTKDIDVVLDEAWNQGINHFDTAAVYGRGLGETILSTKHWRHRAVIATKLSARVKPTAPVKNALSYYNIDYITEQVDESLLRLKRDHIDIYYLHNWFKHWHQEEEEIFGLLRRLKEQGKVIAVGVSLPYWYCRSINSLIVKRLIDVVQLPLNLFQRWAITDVIGTAAKYNVGVVARSPLDHGIISTRPARMNELEVSDDRRDVFTPDRISAASLHLAKIRETIKIDEARLPSFAVASSLLVPGVSTALVGMTACHQVRENMCRDNYCFSKEQCSQIDAFVWKTAHWK